MTPKMSLNMISLKSAASRQLLPELLAARAGCSQSCCCQSCCCQSFLQPGLPLPQRLLPELRLPEPLLL